MFPSTVSEAPSPRLFGLDFLRATAIGMVVLVHGFALMMPHLSRWFELLGHFGYYGVELFFVLSGFLIGRIILRTGERMRAPEELGSFYLRRWFRTLPLFWLFIVFQIFFEWLFRDHRLQLREVLAHAFFLRSFDALQITFFPESWSLAVEEWFYLLFPLALFAGLRVFRTFRPTFLFTVAAFYVLATVARMLEAPQPYANWPEWQRKLVVLRFDALMIGVFGAWLATSFPSAWRRARWFCLAAGVILLLVMYGSLWRIDGRAFVWSADNYFARTFRFNLVSLGFALLLPVGSTWQLERETWFSTCIRRVALWSYALYLVHFPLFQIFDQYLPGLWWNNSFLGAAGCTVLKFSSALLLSALLYRFYESRGTHLRERVVPVFRRFFHPR